MRASGTMGMGRLTALTAASGRWDSPVLALRMSSVRPPNSCTAAAKQRCTPSVSDSTGGDPKKVSNLIGQQRASAGECIIKRMEVK